MNFIIFSHFQKEKNFFTMSYPILENLTISNLSQLVSLMNHFQNHLSFSTNYILLFTI